MRAAGPAAGGPDLVSSPAVTALGQGHSRDSPSPFPGWQTKALSAVHYARGDSYSGGHRRRGTLDLRSGMVPARVAYLAGHEPPPNCYGLPTFLSSPERLQKYAQHLAPNIFQNIGTSLGLVPLRAEAATRKGSGAWAFSGCQESGMYPEIQSQKSDF